jgi:hypothetical protein
MEYEMKRLIIVFGIAMLLLSIQPASACFWVNKDLKKLSAGSAYDVAVELDGNYNITGHFDGYHSGSKVGWFNSFSWGPQSGRTKLHWQNFQNGSDNKIDQNDVIHIGWGNCDSRASKPVDMYWTDASGNKIPGEIYNITSGWHYITSTKKVWLEWTNSFRQGSSDTATITIANVRYAVLNTAVPLENLNTENATLAAQLQVLPGGTGFAVVPGATAQLEVPGSVDTTQSVVVRYEVSAAGSAAAATDFIEITDPTIIPTLSEWGLILLSLVLLGLITYYAVRRRRLAHSAI